MPCLTCGQCLPFTLRVDVVDFRRHARFLSIEIDQNIRVELETSVLDRLDMRNDKG